MDEELSRCERQARQAGSSILPPVQPIRVIDNLVAQKIDKICSSQGHYYNLAGIFAVVLEVVSPQLNDCQMLLEITTD
jgi:hypothetical protein